MSLTLRDALTLRPFVDAGAAVVAGWDGIGRPVHWVHCSEQPEPARLFSGHELLLTQGRGIPPDEDAQQQWVRDLVSTGMAGIAVELGVVLDRLPGALTEEADRVGLPVVAMNHPAYFMEMTRAVHGIILNSDYELLRHADEVSRRLSDLALRGVGVQELLDEISSAVGHPVVLADAMYQIIAFAPNDEQTVDRLSGWREHARHGHDYGARHNGSATVTAGRMTCTFSPIMRAEELWGSLHLLHAGELDDLSRATFDRGVIALALTSISAETHKRRRDDARAVLLRDILSSWDGATNLTSRTRALGVRLAREMRVAHLQPVFAARGTRGADEATHRMTESVTLSAARVLGHAVDGALVGPVQSHVAAVFPSTDLAGNELNRLLAKIVSAVRQECDVEIVIGLSDASQPALLASAARDAELAARHGLRVTNRPAVIPAAELGVHRLLMQLDETAELPAYVRRELGALIDHDRHASSALLPSLAAYLELAGRKTEVARELHIERRTLYHRLDRIGELIRGDLDDGDTRLRLHLAIAALPYCEPGQTTVT